MMHKDSWDHYQKVENTTEKLNEESRLTGKAIEVHNKLYEYIKAKIL